ncbi:MAG: maleylpyruvate isomerase N-terminal domain-containing protein [Dehalococcoidia bacterium]
MIDKLELADGIRFAGRRAAAAAQNTKDWNFQLGHQWTSGDAFRHLAVNAGILSQVYAMLGQEALSALGREQIGQMNDQAISEQAGKAQDEIIQAILDGHDASAAFVETLDEGDLATVIKLGGYEMPKAEIVAQIWIHHAFAHAYEASARWPIT